MIGGDFITVDQLKKAALKSFIEKGYEGASLADIAEVVGIKKQSIYSHFKSKEELFIAVMNDVIREETEFLQDYFAQPYFPVNEYLKDFIIQIKERYIQSEESNMKFVLRMAFMPPHHLKGEVIADFNAYFLNLEELIYRLLKNEPELSVSARKTTSALMTIFDGLMIALIYGRTERFQQKLDASWEIFWAGLERAQLSLSPKEQNF